MGAVTGEVTTVMTKEELPIERMEVLLYRDSGERRRAIFVGSGILFGKLVGGFLARRGLMLAAKHVLKKTLMKALTKSMGRRMLKKLGKRGLKKLVKHLGKNCWWKCGKRNGRCSWCGANGTGMCCRQRYRGGGCDGTVGEKRHHACVATSFVNLGKNCWSKCGRRTGSCSWCGANNAGMCCRRGRKWRWWLRREGWRPQLPRLRPEGVESRWAEG